jgi:hypothetical protein
VLISLNGEPLRKATSSRYLGIDIDEKFNFHKQTSKAILNAKKIIGMLYRLVRKWASVAVLRQAIMTIALPVLFYGIEIWYPPHQHQREQIERVNKFATRLLLNDFNSESSYVSLLDRLKWQTIYRRVIVKRLLNLKKYVDGKRFIQGGIFELEVSPSSRFSQRLMDKKKSHSLSLQLHVHKNTLEDKMAVQQSILIWNALDEDTVRSNSRRFQDVIESNDFFVHLTLLGLFLDANEI